MISLSKPTLKHITNAWQAQVRAAADQPWLFSLLMRQWARLFRRFAHFYHQVLALPRPHKRALKRTLATTLAGAALLLALGQALPARAATIVVDGTNCTLAEAIDSANNDNAAGNGCVDGSGADILDLQTDVILSALLPDITSEITLEGNEHILDGNNAFRVFYVQASGNLTLNNATLTGGYSSDWGGGINNYGTLTVNNSTLSGNSANQYGGGINNHYGTVTLNNSIVSDNTANFSGGIYNRGSLIVNDSTLSGNSGGIVNFTGTVEVNNSTLSDNSAIDGGGILNAFGIVTVNNSTLSGNSATYRGGGLYNLSGTMEVNDSTLSSNTAFNNGGGGISNQGTLTVNNSTLSGNSATYRGGGLYNLSGTMEVNDSTLSNNSASSGGGLSIYNGIVTVNHSTFTNNSAEVAGGIGNLYGTLTVNHSSLSNNSASIDSGGIFNNGTLTVTSSTLSGNSADAFGAIFNFGTLTVNSSTLSGNSARYGAGGITNSGGIVEVNNSTFSGNSATLYDGAGAILSVTDTGTVTVNNSTLTGNTGYRGGGISNVFGSTLNLNRSLISGNFATAGTGAEVFNNQGTVNANHYNVVGYGGDARSSGFTPGPNDLIPPGVLETVLVTTLADNGGPTLTHALVSGSVAMDIALDGDCSSAPINGLDQRGFARNVDGDGMPSSNECDAGAFEYGSVGPPTLTPTPTDTSTPTPTNTPTPTPTPTNTPTPTETPYPEFSIYFPMVIREDSGQTASAQGQFAKSFMNGIIVTLLAVGNLLFFRKGRN